jgi:hypothetical protein
VYLVCWCAAAAQLYVCGLSALWCAASHCGKIHVCDQLLNPLAALPLLLLLLLVLLLCAASQSHCSSCGAQPDTLASRMHAFIVA